MLPPPQPPEVASKKAPSPKKPTPGSAVRCTGFGASGPTRQRRHDGDPGDRACRSKRRQDGGDDCERHCGADEPPGQLCPNHSVVDAGGKMRDVGDPGAKTDERPEERGDPPTTAPLTSMTRRTLRSVAPIDSSMPSARRRRCASTVKPAVATSPTKIRPKTATTNTMTAGLIPFGITGAPASHRREAKPGQGSARLRRTERSPRRPS